jgi:hypothetical protein
MLGKKTQEKLKIWDNETTRYFLILKSAGFTEAISILRYKHQLKGLPAKTIKNKFVTFGAKTHLDRDIDAITDTFGIHRHFVEAVLSERETFELDRLLGYSVPIYHAPITDTGTFIKVSPLTSKKMVMRAYESIKETYREWEENTKKGIHTPQIHDRSTKPKNIIKLATLFVAVEDMLYDNHQYEKEKVHVDDQKASTKNQIYEEAGNVGGFPQKKSEQKNDYIARIRNIYLVNILAYYSLPKFSECQELFETLELHPTS